MDNHYANDIINGVSMMVITAVATDEDACSRSGKLISNAEVCYTCSQTGSVATTAEECAQCGSKRTYDAAAGTCTLAS
jgi:hypothetical protein